MFVQLGLGLSYSRPAGPQAAGTHGRSTERPESRTRIAEPGPPASWRASIGRHACAVRSREGAPGDQAELLTLDSRARGAVGGRGLLLSAAPAARAG